MHGTTTGRIPARDPLDLAATGHPSTLVGAGPGATRQPDLQYADEHVELRAFTPARDTGLDAAAYRVETRNLVARRDPEGYRYVTEMVERQTARLAADGVDRPRRPLTGPDGRELLSRRHEVLDEWWGIGRDRPREAFAFDYMPRWREHVPSAKALWPLQHPGEPTLPFDDGAAPNADDWAVLSHVADAVGIRSRAAVLAAVAEAQLAATEGGSCLSLGSGGLVPILKSAGALGARGMDTAVELWDADPDAIDMAHLLAVRHGLPAPLTTRQVNLYDLRALRSAASQFDLVDLLGFFEYLPTEAPPVAGSLVPTASDFLAAALTRVAPGGTLVLANMRDTHPQLDFVMRCVQWPYIHPRGLDELAAIIRGAGVADERVTFYLPDDDVYAVVEIEG
ncbi:hypothetical protein [Agromyces sp. SYSU T00194]|uniref:hypothetical protein n=1 Tax=Agromyces chitinivorans TaxID=3158560 RepID=UPI003390949E